MSQSKFLRACKKCHRIINIKEEKICPICKTDAHLTKNFSGIIIIIDPEHSNVAERLQVTQSGRYAIKVR